MASALDIMALTLLTQLTARGFEAPSLFECRAILQDVFEETTAVGAEMERRGREREPA